MRIVYPSDAQIPSRATNAMQTVRMCAALSRAGAEVTLVHPRIRSQEPEGFGGSLWSFYGVPPAFRIVTLPTPLTARTAKLSALSRAARLLPLAAYLGWRSRPGQPPFICYGRSFVGVWLAARLRRLWGHRCACRGIFLELHDVPPAPQVWRLLSRVDGVIAISGALRDALVRERPALAQRAWVEHDGVDLDSISPALLDCARRRTEIPPLPAGGPVVAYTGRLIAGKGVDVLLDAAPALGALGARLLLVGKVYEPAYLERARAQPHVTLAGFVPPAEVPSYLAAADIVVLPTTEDIPYAAYTSPLKLFEYMASGRPLVASDLPVFREVLEHDRNALLYPPDDAAALVAAITRLIERPELGVELARQAWRDVRRFGWEARAHRLLERIDAVVDGSV